jgi:hypothetical protein
LEAASRFEFLFKDNELTLSAPVFRELGQVPSQVRKQIKTKFLRVFFSPHIMIPCYCYHERSFIYETAKAIVVLVAPEAIPAQLGIAN